VPLQPEASPPAYPSYLLFVSDSFVSKLQEKSNKNVHLHGMPPNSAHALYADGISDWWGKQLLRFIKISFTQTALDAGCEHSSKDHGFAKINNLPPYKLKSCNSHHVQLS
jgi:hypothetical protein